MLTHGLGIHVRSRSNEPEGQMVRRFMRSVREAKLIDEIRDRMSFKTTRERRRLKDRQARQRKWQEQRTEERRSEKDTR